MNLCSIAARRDARMATAWFWQKCDQEFLQVGAARKEIVDAVGEVLVRCGIQATRNPGIDNPAQHQRIERE